MYDKRDFWETVDPGALNRKQLEWLGHLRRSVSSIFVFGCWDAGDTQDTCYEPYVLQRILEASQVVVVDKEAKYIRNAQGWLERTRVQYPDFWNNCNFEFVVGDMTEETERLVSNYFDLAYCSSVLNNMESDIKRLQSAVNTMARVVKPGRWVVADEGIELHKQFKEAGLEEEIRPEDVPESVYFYRKPFAIG